MGLVRAADGDPQFPRQHEAQAVFAGQVQSPLHHYNRIGDKHPAVIGFQILGRECHAFVHNTVVVAQLPHHIRQHPEVHTGNQEQSQHLPFFFRARVRHAGSFSLCEICCGKTHCHRCYQKPGAATL